ncbi:hypothetical protein CSB92_0914 [Pseudomonas aeruginosa]|nr:hypothetical protein CSC30_2107 [Pseudomonas aeruginosa]AWF67313.1 hypothetical protein CSC27_4701 [Pseudomonas aeruginosa]PRW16885.1 hypothetical protein CSB92_0914 [Pseudomonas aeruginosa]BAQ42172.1 group III type IV pilin subunit [Pseudomonas aeruginosa]
MQFKELGFLRRQVDIKILRRKHFKPHQLFRRKASLQIRRPIQHMKRIKHMNKSKRPRLIDNINSRRQAGKLK